MCIVTDELRKVVHDAVVAQHNVYKKIEPYTTEFVLRLAEETGGTVHGLQYRFKTIDSTVRKVLKRLASSNEITLEEVIRDIKDMLRYTIVYETNHFVNGVNAADTLIKNDQNYQLIRLKNRFNDQSQPYSDILTNLKECSEQMVFELQFHTPDSLRAKTVSHHIYELMRATSEDFSDEVIDTLNQTLYELYDLFVSRPDGVSTIKNV